MKGIIIAGGAGTRLRPLTYTRPKPLIPVVNRPFLEYQVAWLRKYGIDEIIFCTNYMSDAIAAHFGDGSDFGVRMQYAIETTPLGTAGAIKNAQVLAGNDTFVVLNGDVLTDFDLDSIVSFHRSMGSISTLTLKEVPSPSPYGVIDTDHTGRVLEFREPTESIKKALASATHLETTGVDYINAGIYIMEPEALEHIPTGRPVSVERETYPLLLQQGAPVYATAREGFWLDIGRPAQYRQATNAILSREIAVDPPGAWDVAGYWIEAGAEVNPTAHIAPTVHIGKNARVHSGASVTGNSVIGRNCRVGTSTTLTDVILEANVLVGDGCHLEGVILDDGCHVEDDVIINIPSVYAAGTVLRKGTRIVSSAD